MAEGFATRARLGRGLAALDGRCGERRAGFRKSAKSQRRVPIEFIAESAQPAADLRRCRARGTGAARSASAA